MPTRCNYDTDMLFPYGIRWGMVASNTYTQGGVLRNWRNLMQADLFQNAEESCLRLFLNIKFITGSVIDHFLP